jgi:hypothetical protein
VTTFPITRESLYHAGVMICGQTNYVARTAQRAPPVWRDPPRHATPRLSDLAQESAIRGDRALFLDVMQRVALEGAWPDVARACAIAQARGDLRRVDPDRRLRAWATDKNGSLTR